MQAHSTTINAKEAAKFLGISYWSLLNLVRTKTVPHIRLGKVLRFRVVSLEEFLMNEEKSSVESDSSNVG